MRVLVIDNEDSSYAGIFSKYGYVDCIPNPTAHMIREYGLLVYVGGNDVSPELYNHRTNSKTHSYLPLDGFNKLAHFIATEMEPRIPVVGICKGAQQVFVFNGGTLYQHVNNHCETHSAVTTDPEYPIIQVTSSHHQMFDLHSIDPCEYELLAWCEPRSDRYERETDDDVGGYKVDPEVVYFPDTNQLAVQYHPEWMSTESPGYKYFDKLVQERLL